MNLSSLVGHVTELLLHTQGSAQPVDRLVSAFFHARTYLGSRDRRFISDALYGIIRKRRFLEALLEQYLREHPGSDDLDQPQKRFLPLYGIYALTVGRKEGDDPLPSSLWMAAFPTIRFDEFARWIEEHASLDFLASSGETSLAVRESFQDWMVERWRAQVGEELPDLLASLNLPAEVTLRVNSLRTTRDECAARLALEGIPVVPSRYSREGLVAGKRFNAQISKAFAEGWFELQDEGSQFVSLLANPRPGEVVIDGCAGAGGKALHLAAMMENTGEIIAIDSEPKRLRELEKRVRRAGVTIARPLLNSEMIPELLASTADLILVDAPCSGSGTIRRNPSFKWTLTESLVSHYHVQQSEILAFNARFVKPGGRLVYATCSLFREENEDVVEAFLGAHPGFRLASLREAAARLGISSTEDMLTLYPHRTRTDGFFIALLVRKS